MTNIKGNQLTCPLKRRQPIRILC